MIKTIHCTTVFSFAACFLHHLTPDDDKRPMMAIAPKKRKVAAACTATQSEGGGVLTRNKARPVALAPPSKSSQPTKQPLPPDCWRIPVPRCGPCRKTSLRWPTRPQPAVRPHLPLKVLQQQRSRRSWRSLWQRTAPLPRRTDGGGQRGQHGAEEPPRYERDWMEEEVRATRG